MTSRISAITMNTFREAVRDRVLYNLIVFVLILLASAPLFSQISIDIERLMLINLGLSSISLFGVVIAIFIGIGLVSKEIEKRTLYTILSRPVRRWEFIVGKYLGLVLTLITNAAFMTIGFFAALFLYARPLTAGDAVLLVAVYFILLEFLVITALTLLFSSFSSPIFAALFSFSLFVIGTFSEDLRNFAAMSHGLNKLASSAAAWIVPNFASLNVISRVAHRQPVAANLIAFNTLYALLYSATVTAAAVLVFERKNLK
jgi:ABC-type transport system involved in multi-copper enzyme maturation permease subunit